MNDIKSIIEDCHKSDLVSKKVIRKIIEIIGQERWQELYDEESDICTTMGELIVALEGDKWHTSEEEPVAHGKYANQDYPQIPCLVLFKHFDYGVRYWNVKEKCWDDEEADDFYCDMDKVEKWAYIKED